MVEQLEKNYQYNLKVFKAYLPDIYKLLKKNQDNSYSIEIESSDINIAIDGELLYPKNTQNYFNNLINHYILKGNKSLLKYQIGVLLNNDSVECFGVETIHKKYMLKITKAYIKTYKKYPIINEDILPKHNNFYSAIIYGIGLGYHILPLVEKFNIRHLYIVDRSIEMLRVSLYTTNWYEIIKYFKKDNYSLNISIDKNGNSKELSKKILTNIYVKQHLAYYNMGEFISYKDDILLDIQTNINNNISNYNGTFKGFFDDEKWGLQHTINSLKSDIPILTNNSIQVDKNKFVFVIGNGPSLDSYIKIIKKYRDNAMVVASGTAINSLYSYGVVPDIYVAIERTIDMFSDVTENLPKEYTDKITFIGMNTLHPRLFAQFKKKFMFLKSQDTGTDFINNERYRILNYSNPTVTNGALSLIISLGFKNICLFGMDFGYKDRKNHHSKNSIYLDKSHKYSKLEFKDEIEVEGVD
ncbi:MAG: 6-hydroxymethylpterin diphosphokinase MptE-like protein, partial [Campylobacterota bacterium]|nr:6-hydroxymethylpterin diphosphokinase MptE-like protein [Campylobacterota bacterium]